MKLYRIFASLSILSIVILFTKYSLSQAINNTENNIYNTAKTEIYLSNEEKNLIYYTNFMRQNPKLFLSKYLTPFLDSAQVKPNSFTKSLLIELNKNNKLPILFPQKELYLISKKHAIDMGKNGMMGHNTSSGKNYMQRVDTLINTYSFVKENCQYGYQKGIDILIDLMIDEGINDLGHRKTLLDAKLKYIGCSIEYHKKYRYNCVMEFAGKKLNE